MQICLHFVIKDVSLFSGGGEGHSFWGRVILISLLSGGGSQFFFQGFLAEGHNFFKFFLLKKYITNTLLQWELVFASYLLCPLRQKKCPKGRNKAIYMNLNVRYGILKEGQTDRRILIAFSSRTITRYIY